MGVYGGGASALVLELVPQSRVDHIERVNRRAINVSGEEMRRSFTEFLTWRAARPVLLSWL